MKTILVIDGHALAYRQYYALERTAMTTSENQPTWAVFGFFKTVVDMLKNKKIKIDAIVVAFDVSKRSFRTEKFSDYKATRTEMPDNMKSQMSLIQEGLRAFNIPIFTKEGYEADDVIGTVCKKAKDVGHRVYILTGDQDSFQLVDKGDNVTVLVAGKGQLIEYDWFKIHDKLGVYPNQVVDYKALAGDSSDNIPGVRGIGEKTAIKLLSQYKSLDNILENFEQITPPSIREKIRNGFESAKMCKDLATIRTDVDIDFDAEKACVQLPHVGEVTKFLQKMQFHTFIKNIDNILRLFSPTCEGEAELQVQLGLFAQSVEMNHQNHPFDTEIVEDNIEKVAQLLSEQSMFSICVQPMENDHSIISEIAFGFELPDKTTKVICIPANVNLKNNLQILKPVLENKNIKKTFHNGKYECSILKDYGINLEGFYFDTILASYIKDSSRPHEIKTQSLEHLNYIMIDINNACEKAYCILKLTQHWEKSLDKTELRLLNEIDIPLTHVLVEMERQGVSLDREYLVELSKDFGGKLDILEEQIHLCAKKDFNVNSAVQVANILYHKMGIREIKKGNKFTTTAEVLESVAHKHEICRHLLEFRRYAKLKSTYTDALPELISPKDGKIHTNFNQTIATTGRLSSSSPNLQNIPTRIAEASKIRRAFVPSDKETQVLLSADYSQIELRLLAHYSNDENLIQDFMSDVDIHTETAAKVYKVPVNKVTKEMRSKAKAVNFGIVYGQGKYGLSKVIKTTLAGAEKFINRYFETYPKVYEYMQKTIQEVHDKGYVETMFGRKRYLYTGIHSTNKNVRDAAERAAINHPLQGTAADLIKVAMITLYRRLTDEGLKSKLILQVHDELIIETYMDELDVVQKIVKETMELGQPLNVPLVVNLAYGKNWVEL